MAILIEDKKMKTVNDFLIKTNHVYSTQYDGFDNKECPATEVYVAEYNEKIGGFSWNDAERHMIYGKHLVQKHAILKKLGYINQENKSLNIKDFGIALFGEKFEANNIQKIIVDENGKEFARQTIQSWIDRESKLPDSVISQLKKEVKKRKNDIEILIDSY
ncbi:hypothetical protein AVENLUH5627_02709 [Acinetobacter venetianus]|uniref:Uncharacterized protein n=2 Tax=Acinetobacter venetianus TaxID=52133 RepID=A0A150HM55_9GAMM|nr:hypothetical protein AVENLUH5627_02709 [Acinetobacter venetianus]